MNRVRSYQRGSTMTFVIIGIILTVGLIGTIFVLRQHGEQVRKEQAITTYDKEQADKKSAEDTKKTAVAKTNATKGTDNEALVNAAEELPATGPKNVIIEVLSLSLLTVSIMSYLSSRRDLARSL